LLLCSDSNFLAGPGWTADPRRGGVEPGSDQLGGAEKETREEA
jgi:hypothetical protein